MSIDPTPEADQLKAEAFFRRHPSWFLAYYVYCYPAAMTLDQAVKLRELAERPPRLITSRPVEVVECCSDHWFDLSHNEALPWSEQLIDQYANRWDWEALSVNPGLPWSEQLIDHYVSRWDWEALSRNPGLPWSIEWLNRYASRWDWDGLSRRDWLPWSEELVDLYADRWSWYPLSRNGGLPWSEAFINSYADRWALRANMT